MTRISVLIALSVFALSGAAHAVSGGKLGTLGRGIYTCELPGDATSSRGIEVPEAGFEVTHSSTYRTERGRGIYLRTGDNVTMTSGPKKGERYVLKNENFLRKIDEDGKETGMRCVRLGSPRN